MNLYADIILDHWQNPQNSGTLSNYDLEAEEVNPLCGDEIRIQIKLSHQRSAISDVRFSGNGCAISQAAASILTERIKGMDVKNVLILSDKDMINLLSITPGPARIKCTLLALFTVKKALKQIDRTLDN